MGFAVTAAYFEKRSKRETDSDRKADLKEVAEFYRRLAGIAPGFPAGFDGGTSSSRHDRWQQRAEESRTMAECFGDPQCREQMIQLADSYAKLAIAAK